MKRFIFMIFATLLFANTGQAQNNCFDDIVINIRSTKKPGISMLEIVWPDGIVDRFEYKDQDVKNGSTDYIEWFKERIRVCRDRMEHK